MRSTVREAAQAPDGAVTVSTFAGDGSCAEATLEEVEACLARGELVWTDVRTPSAPQIERLARIFDLHPLAVDDALAGGERPHLEEYENQLFLTVYAIGADPASIGTDRIEIDVFAGKGFLVTLHHGADGVSDEVRRRCRSETARMTQLGIGFLLYAFLDTIVDGYAPALDVVEERIEEIEQRLTVARDREAMAMAFALKRELLYLRRIVSPTRDTLNALQRADARILGADIDVYLRDVYDHTIHHNEEIDVYRDLLTSATSAQLSVIANDQSDTTKVLSAWGAILFVPTIVTGIYGMNFRNIPELRGRYGYPLTLLAIAAMMLLLYWNFRRRGWLSRESARPADANGPRPPGGRGP